MNSAIALWNQVLAEPAFRDLPYKLETTRSGAIMMTPASNWHGSAQYHVGQTLGKSRKGGDVINECSILTSDGVKVADVAWVSDEFLEQHGYQTPYLVAPEICVEVASPGNSREEIERKVDLYLAKGALEVWIVAEDETVSFFDKTGPLKKSKLVKSVTIRKRG